MRSLFNNNDYYGNNGCYGNDVFGPRRISRRRSPNGYNSNNRDQLITQLTEAVLANDDDGYVTSDGRIMPRNTAFQRGERNGTELLKKRVWGSGVRTNSHAGLFWKAFDPATDQRQENDFTTEEEDKKTADENELRLKDDANKINVTYSPDALQSIANFSTDPEEAETGGALIGTWARSSDGCVEIRVERATGPGVKAERKAERFSPDLEHYRERIAFYSEKYGWSYLGEWHRHPKDLSSLSHVDLTTAKDLIQSEGWPFLLLPIVSENEENGKMLMRGHLVFSSQLGGDLCDDTELLELPTPTRRHKISVYIDKKEIDDFLAGDKHECVIPGLYNQNESFIFMDIPVVCNACLHLVKDDESKVRISGGENIVTALVKEGNVLCYRSIEGEIETLDSHLIDPTSTIYERNEGLAETHELKNKTVTLVGCGSLGSTMALSLARAGVGNFCLFDCDRLSPLNIIRHQGSLADLGRPKTDVISDRIRCIDPIISVDKYGLDIVKDQDGYAEFMEAAQRSDLLVCTTDTDDSRMLVNDVAVKCGIRAIQAGLHERATSGIVHSYVPGSEEACYACHQEQILSESSKRNEKIAYSEANDIREITVQPGLAAQIDLVGQVAVLRCIDSLMERDSLPSLTTVFIDDLPAQTDERDVPQSGTERSLVLKIRHLFLEKVASCPHCGLENFHEDEDSNSEDNCDEPIFQEERG